jgi:dihydroxyacetone kinase
MKKFLNAAERFVPEMIEGILAAHPGRLTSVAGDLHCIVKDGPKTPNKVGIASGGGSGHLPLFLGYIGDGLLDGCSIGDVFQSPSSEQMLEVTRAIDAGAGVLYIYGNYGGDVLNFDMAIEMASMEDIKSKRCSAPTMLRRRRRPSCTNDAASPGSSICSSARAPWPRSLRRWPKSRASPRRRPRTCARWASR